MEVRLLERCKFEFSYLGTDGQAGRQTDRHTGSSKHCWLLLLLDDATMILVWRLGVVATFFVAGRMERCITGEGLERKKLDCEKRVKSPAAATAAAAAAATTTSSAEIHAA